MSRTTPRCSTPPRIVDAVAETGMRAWLEHETPIEAPASDRDSPRLAAAAVAIGAGLLVQELATDGRLAVALFALAIALAGVQPLRKAWLSIRRRSLDIHVLMVVAVAGAMAIGEWAEAATVVCLFAVSQWLEVRTMERARAGDPRGDDPGADRGARQARPTRAEGAGRTRAPRRRRGRASRREDPARRRRRVGPVRRQPGADHRRVAADRARPWRRSLRRHDQRARRARRAGDPRGPRHHARPDRAPGGDRAGAAGARPAVHRPVRALVHAGGGRGGRRGLRGAGRAGAAGRRLGLPRAGAAGRRVPVRAGDLDPGVDRRRARHRGPARRAHQGRRASRTAGRGPGDGLRQDRHAHSRRAGGRRRRRADTRRARPGAGRRRRGRVPVRASDCPGGRRRGRAARRRHRRRERRPGAAGTRRRRPLRRRRACSSATRR